PVAVKDYWAVSPIPQRVDVVIKNLKPDTPSLRAAVEDSLQQMLFMYASPGSTIFAAWKSYAIMSTIGIESFDLLINDDDVMPSPGHMAVLGDVTYESASVPIAPPPSIS
ncbi:MAG TPA: hypothetical protein VH593_27595, partial [Ktedonobacteraceae bacterium]